MKSIFSILLSLALTLSITGCGTSGGELPPLSSVRPGVAGEGTLANSALTRDATLALRKHTGGNKEIIKFVVQKPVGKPGNKAWRELWVYDMPGAKKQFIMTFREDGQGSANFEVTGM